MAISYGYGWNCIYSISLGAVHFINTLYSGGVQTEIFPNFISIDHATLKV